MVKNQQFSRSKHIDIRYHFIRDLKESNIIDLIYCSTDNNMIADMMTKPIRSTRLIELSEECGLITSEDGDVEEECGKETTTPM